MPGVNVPWSQVFYYLITLTISGVFHEFGHAISAIRYASFENFLAWHNLTETVLQRQNLCTPVDGMCTMEPYGSGFYILF